MPEGDILYTQRQTWKDPNNVLQSWDPTLVNPCTWFHVTCNNDNSVIRVYVTSVFSFLPFFSRALYCWIFADQLNHTSIFPDCAGIWEMQASQAPWLLNWEEWRTCSICKNLMQSSLIALQISADWSSHLCSELYGNNFSGPIPTTLGNLTSLVSLDLYSNSLTGAIPTSLGAVGTLRYLYESCRNNFRRWNAKQNELIRSVACVSAGGCMGTTWQDPYRHRWAVWRTLEIWSFKRTPLVDLSRLPWATSRNCSTCMSLLIPQFCEINITCKCNTHDFFHIS
jgi:hypothetical protein